MKRQFVLFLGVMAAMLAGCSNPENEDSIQLSDVSCAFSSAGGSQTVRVMADGNWSADSNSPWISLDKGSDFLTIFVEDNRDRNDRFGEIVVIAGSSMATISVNQIGNPQMLVMYRKSYSSIYSPSCELSGMLRSDIVDSKSVFFVGIQHLREDRIDQYGPYDADRYPVSTIRTMDDRGNMFLTSENHSDVYYFNVKDGSIVKFDSNATVYDVSADGTVAVGITQGNITSMGVPMSVPVKWVNDHMVYLPMPDKPFTGTYEDWSVGLIPRGVSNDGKVIFATEWQAGDWYLVWWDENDEWHYVGEDIRYVEHLPVTDGKGNTYLYPVTKGMMNTSSSAAVSNNGTWICGWYYQVDVREDGAMISEYYPGFYNTRENKTYIMWDYPDGMALVAREDGIGFIRTSTTPFSDHTLSDFFTVDIKSGETISNTQEWFFDNYGIYPPAKTIYRGFSDDYRVAVAYDSFIVDNR